MLQSWSNRKERGTCAHIDMYVYCFCLWRSNSLSRVLVTTDGVWIGSIKFINTLYVVTTNTITVFSNLSGMHRVVCHTKGSESRLIGH
jgi:hypothetical protein